MDEERLRLPAAKAYAIPMRPGLGRSRIFMPRRLAHRPRNIGEAGDGLAGTYEREDSFAPGRTGPARDGLAFRTVAAPAGHHSAAHPAPWRLSSRRAELRLRLRGRCA